MNIKPDDVVKVPVNMHGAYESYPQYVKSQANFTVIAIDQNDPPAEVCILTDGKGNGFELTDNVIASFKGYGYRMSSAIDQYKGKMMRWIYSDAVLSVVIGTRTNAATTQRQADYEPCAACKEPIYMGAKDATCFSCRSNPMRKYY